MTVANKLTYLAATKTALREAINAAGGNLSTATPFRQYTGLMQEMSATLDLQFWCERFITRRRGSMAPHAVGVNNIVTFTRSTTAWEFNEFGQYVQRAINEWRNAHDPASLTTSTSTASFEASTATFILPTGHAFFVGDLFRATAVSGSIWGIVTARSATSVTIYVRNAVGSGAAASWTCIKPIGIRIEEQRTNLRTNSANAGVWGRNSPAHMSATITTFAAPIAGEFLWEVRDTGNGDDFFAHSASVPNNSGLYTASIFVQKTTAALSACALGIVFSGGTLVAGFVTLNTNTGEVRNASAVVSAAVVDHGLLWRLIVTVANNASGNTTITQRFYPANKLNSTPGAIRENAVMGSANVWGSQLELGASPTSYIPTEASQVIRAADVCSVNTLSPWYNASEGAIVVDAAPGGSSATRLAIASLDDTTSGNRIQMTHSGASAASAIVSTSGAVVAGEFLTPTDSWPMRASRKAALSYKENAFAFSLAGAPPLTDTSGSLPPVTRLGIGAGSGSSTFNGTISRITYYPRVLGVQQASA